MNPEHSPGITLLGLGPGSPDLLTRQAWELLGRVDEIHMRTRQHPSAAAFPASLQVISFDPLFERAESLDSAYAEIIETILALGTRPQGVVYAVPGHPFIGEATAPEIARRARAAGLPVNVIAGLSFLDAAFSALELDPLPHTAVVDALELALLHVPPFPPGVPALVAQLSSQELATQVRLTLAALYPGEHHVKLIHAAGTPQQQVEALPLSAIDQSPHFGALSLLWAPPLGRAASFEAFQEVIAHLRAPDGCPWDKEQTHTSLRPYLLEEAYEVLSALDAGDTDGLREELGDLLLQVVLHAQIAADNQSFTMADILRGIHTKIVQRHPHVFGEVELKDAQAVLQNWERLKESERSANGKVEASLLDGVAPTLPALSQAEEIQRRAARVKFDWPEISGVIDKVNEELAEVQAAVDPQEREAEIGDLLFAAVNLARWHGVDAESALRQTNIRFRQRFGQVEQAARQQGRSITALSMDEMEALWQLAKKKILSD